MTNIPLIQNNRDRVLFNKIVFKLLKENILVPTILTKFNTSNFLYKIHQPFYNSIKNYVTEKTKGSVFFDSVLFAILLFTYPLFLLFLYFILKLLSIPTTVIFVILVALPIMAKRVQD
jgi:hypothetical protein